MIRKLNPTDELNFVDYCQKRDKFSDFYVLKNHHRVFLTDIKVAKLVFTDIIRRGDKCWIVEKSADFSGILLITGYANKSNRKYIKILSDTRKDTNSLINFALNDIRIDLFCQLKQNNYIYPVLKKYGFSEISKIKNEIIMCRKPYDKRKF
jgi:hypothetical protein